MPPPVRLKPLTDATLLLGYKSAGKASNMVDHVEYAKVAVEKGVPTLVKFFGRETAQAMVAAANEITAGICAVDCDKPDAVCESKGVLAADQVLKITPPH